MIKLRGGMFLATIAMVATEYPAEAATDSVVTQALELHAAGHADQAYALLSPHEAARVGDPDFDYALGLAAADSGHLGEALIALQRVLAVQPNNAPARAELARVYALSGDVDTAKAEFDTVVADPTIPDPVRNRFNRLIRGFDQQIKGGPNKVTGFAEAESGYDGNINSATDATSITLPAFAFLGPATLNGAARGQNDGFYQLQAGLSGSAALGRNTRAYLSALGNWRDNFKSSAFDQAALTGSASIVHSLQNGDAVSLTGQVQNFWLGHAQYRTSYGVIGQYTKKLKDGHALAVGLQYFHQTYDGNPLNDANRYAGSVTYSGKYIYGGIGGGKEKTVRAGASHLGYGFVSGQLGAEVPLNERTAIIAGASAEHRAYDSTDPLFLIGRRDTQLDGSLGIKFVLRKGLTIRPRATYTRNFSNIALNDYDRVTASVGLRFEF
jgi:tetratricopeptide (TPR) repeat protein